MSKKSDAFKKKYIIHESRINDKQKEKLYEQFVDQQREQFELYINYINELLIVLKDYRIVSDFTKVKARIKATESAISNDSEKALDDVFGIEIDFATPGEKDFVSGIIKGTMNVVKEKIHKKDNGYEAYHFSGYPTSKKVIIEVFEELINKTIEPEEEYKNYYDKLSQKNRDIADLNKEKNMQYYTELKENFESYSKAIKNRMNGVYMEDLKKELQEVETKYLEIQRNASSENYIPIIEAQSKLIQVAIEANLGEASHDEYKGFTSEEMQKKYDALGGKIPLSELPAVYTSDLKRDEYGNIIPMILRSSHKTLEIIYPGLITNRHRRRQEREGE